MEKMGDLRSPSLSTAQTRRTIQAAKAGRRLTPTSPSRPMITRHMARAPSYGTCVWHVGRERTTAMSSCASKPTPCQTTATMFSTKVKSLLTHPWSATPSMSRSIGTSQLTTLILRLKMSMLRRQPQQLTCYALQASTLIATTSRITFIYRSGAHGTVMLTCLRKSLECS